MKNHIGNNIHSKSMINICNAHHSSTGVHCKGLAIWAFVAALLVKDHFQYTLDVMPIGHLQQSRY